MLENILIEDQEADRESNFKLDARELGCGNCWWMVLAQDRVERRALVVEVGFRGSGCDGDKKN